MGASHKLSSRHACSFSQDGISKLKRLLEGESTEVSAFSCWKGFTFARGDWQSQVQHRGIY